MKPRIASGFTLIEVLVAVAILSFGMLGIAAMQITGVRANQGSYFRSQATFIVNDMAERLYSNRAGTRAFAYDGYSSTTGCASPPTVRCSVDYVNTGTPTACSAAQMASYDTYYVSCGYADGTNRLGGVRDLLPDGALTITCLDSPCVADSMRQISVSWSERVATSNTTASSTQQSSGSADLQTQTINLRVQP